MFVDASKLKLCTFRSCGCGGLTPHMSGKATVFPWRLLVKAHSMFIVGDRCSVHMFTEHVVMWNELQRHPSSLSELSTML